MSLNDIDDDDVPTCYGGPSPVAAQQQQQGGPTMDDIFGGLGEAPKPRRQPPTASAATAPSASASPTAATTTPKPAKAPSSLDDFFAPSPASGGTATTMSGANGSRGSTGATSSPAPGAGVDLLGGGNRKNALAELVDSDKPYVPPPGVLALMSHYEVLGVPPTASAEAIHRTYKKLAIVFHPDRRGSDLTPDEAHYFKLVATAQETLCDPELRKAYDAERKAASAPSLQQNLFTHMQ